MAGGCPAAALLPLAALLATGSGAARAVPEEEQHPIDLIKRNFVYGNTKQEVNVYVKAFTSSPVLVCMDLARSQEKVIDPKYLWIGPDGKKLEGQMYRNPTERGKLKVKRFKESMSGVYTCTRSYKSIDSTKQEEREMVEAYRFRVYAYREADHAYQILVHFTTKECELAANNRFFKELKKIVNNFISDLMCHITESSYKCRSAQTPTQRLQPRLFVSFQVNPFAPGWEEVCHQVPHNCEDATNTRVEEVLCQPPSCFLCPFNTNFCLGRLQARNRIEEFFSEQTYALKHEFQTIPTIRYVDNSFSALQIDSCRPGFGKNNITHQSCAGCCVVCEPGTYSPNNDVTCQICSRRRVRKYGARSC